MAGPIDGLLAFEPGDPCCNQAWGLGLVLALCVVAPGAAWGECQSCEEGQLHFVLTGGGH